MEKDKDLALVKVVIDSDDFNNLTEYVDKIYSLAVIGKDIDVVMGEDVIVRYLAILADYTELVQTICSRLEIK